MPNMKSLSLMVQKDMAKVIFATESQTDRVTETKIESQTGQKLLRCPRIPLLFYFSEGLGPW